MESEVGSILMILGIVLIAFAVVLMGVAEFTAKESSNLKCYDKKGNVINGVTCTGKQIEVGIYAGPFLILGLMLLFVGFMINIDRLMWGGVYK